MDKPNVRLLNLKRKLRNKLANRGHVECTPEYVNVPIRLLERESRVGLLRPGREPLVALSSYYDLVYSPRVIIQQNFPEVIDDMHACVAGGARVRRAG